MAHLIQKISQVTVPEGFTPIEQTTTVSNLEQFVQSVVKCTSRYNVTFSVSYSPDNLVGRYVKYPSYGDFPETYHLRTYGKWWMDSDGFQQPYMPQDVDPLGAEDYVCLQFESPVIPRHVCIYETYNPGAIVRIWGRCSRDKWKLLWEGHPQKCLEESRKFIPNIRQYNCFINEIKLEFNQSQLKYHTSIDAVLLGGYQPLSKLQSVVLKAGLLDSPLSLRCIQNEDNEDGYDIKNDYFSLLPHEVMIHIFRNLDLKSLSMCAQVNNIWYEVTLDPILYQDLSLKRHWNYVNGDTLDYFKNRCKGFKKLDLSWCGDDDDGFSLKFISFIQECGEFLTNLSLCHCKFVSNRVIEEISRCKYLTELRLRNTNTDVNGSKHLLRLNKLITLDLQMTNITDDVLILIIKNNPYLKHLNLDLCEQLQRLDQVVEIASQYNPNLTTWSSWKTLSLTSHGITHFSRCKNLKELDLGWCFVHTHPGDVLEQIAWGCKKLKRLIISQWREINDAMLLPVIQQCKDLTQLDLLGINTISRDLIEMALVSLPQLQLLDISFCDSVDLDEVLRWRQRFPKVTIQWSCQYVVMDYLN